MPYKTLAMDIETFSRRDLTKCGVYSYVEDEEFEILLFAYAFDDENVKIIDLKNGEELPYEVRAALINPDIRKASFNANFERVCLGAFYKVYLPPQQWSCTMVQALELGLPSSLKELSRCLKLPEQKMEEGKELVRYFSMPYRNTVKDSYTRNLPNADKVRWKAFKEYCKRDVEVERSIRKKLSSYEITEKEQRLWCLDQAINDRGVRVHRQLVAKAMDLSFSYQKSLEEEAAKLTGIQNPKSTAQLKKWLKEREGIEVETLSKDNVESLIAEVSSERVKKALKLRQELSKTSVKKYEAMERSMCSDNKIRGLFQFCGASRTARWSSKLVQVQNLPQSKLQNLEAARDLLMGGRYEELGKLFKNVPEVLSQLIRTAFIPSENFRFIASDYSAIEARIVAWLANQVWRLEVFRAHGKIYEASAAQMFKVPIDSVTKDNPLRQRAKIAELALGYQGSTGALKSMGALKLGFKEEELDRLVNAWRASNPNIVRLWQEVEKSALTAVRDRTAVRLPKGIEFSMEKGILFIRLPSGRRLAYVRPRIEMDESFNKPRITYEGVEQCTKQWGRLSTYGGKLVENIVQAIARDCLAEAMLRLEEAGYKIVMHIHDEVVLDVSYGFGSVEEVQTIMAEPIAWAKGLPLRAEAFEGDYYKK